MFTPHNPREVQWVTPSGSVNGGGGGGGVEGWSQEQEHVLKSLCGEAHSAPWGSQMSAHPPAYPERDIPDGRTPGTEGVVKATCWKRVLSKTLHRQSGISKHFPPWFLAYWQPDLCKKQETGSPHNTNWPKRRKITIVIDILGPPIPLHCSRPFPVNAIRKPTSN